MFEGQTVFCIASGPSLTPEDCALVEASGHPIVAVNSSWKAVRSASVIFGGDQAWWDAYRHEIDIPAKLWTCNMNASLKHGLLLLRNPARHWNSGLRAIELAVFLGAAKVVLLGYDCSVKKGLHWHGKHVKTQNPTTSLCQSWELQFNQLSKTLKVPVVNCSRETSLKCFPRAKIEEILCLQHSPEETPLKMSLNSVAS